MRTAAVAPARAIADASLNTYTSNAVRATTGKAMPAPTISDGRDKRRRHVTGPKSATPTSAATARKITVPPMYSTLLMSATLPAPSPAGESGRSVGARGSAEAGSAAASA
ncbi:hypothetical protein D3C71_1779360 [compost metagenome]